MQPVKLGLRHVIAVVYVYPSTDTPLCYAATDLLILALYTLPTSHTELSDHGTMNDYSVRITVCIWDTVPIRVIERNEKRIKIMSCIAE